MTFSILEEFHTTRPLIRAQCDTCSAILVFRRGRIPTWHQGCTAPKPQTVARRFSCDESLPPGSSPKWEAWSRELDAGAVMDPGLVSQIKAWRSNQEYVTWSADDYAIARRTE